MIEIADAALDAFQTRVNASHLNAQHGIPNLLIQPTLQRYSTPSLGHRGVDGCQESPALRHAL